MKVLNISYLYIIFMVRDIKLRTLQKPKQKNITEDINWLTNSLCLVSGRDTKRMSSKVLCEALKHIAEHGSTNTEQLAKKLDSTIQRINYHIKSIIQSGLMYREKKQILLRQGSVKGAIEEIRKDANRIFDELEQIAKEIDQDLGFKNR